MAQPITMADAATLAPRRDEGLSATHDRRRNYRRAAFGLAMLAPAFVFFVMWVFLPLAYGIYLSFTNSTLTNTPQLVGLSNYRTLWHDPLWWSSLTRTFDYVGEVVVPTLVLAFVMARLAINCRRGRALLMSIYFLPYVIPGVVAALIFSSLFQPYGLINTVLKVQISWLSNPKTAMYAMSIVTIWSLVGFYVVIFMAGFQQISREYVEAARMDGATTWQLIRRVELPLLRPTLIFSAVTAIAFVMTNFGTPYVLTDGGPANATTTLPLLIYNETFNYSNAGVGSAMAVVLVLLSVILTVIMLRVVFARGTRVRAVTGA
jgi:ABC-type sugar transport system permease subunit